MICDRTTFYLFFIAIILVLGAAAATALQNICVTCNKCMSRHMTILLQLLHQVDTFSITNNAVIGILKGKETVIYVNLFTIYYVFNFKQCLKYLL